MFLIVILALFFNTSSISRAYGQNQDPEKICNTSTTTGSDPNSGVVSYTSIFTRCTYLDGSLSEQCTDTRGVKRYFFVTYNFVGVDCYKAKMKSHDVFKYVTGMTPEEYCSLYNGLYQTFHINQDGELCEITVKDPSLFNSQPAGQDYIQDSQFIYFHNPTDPTTFVLIRVNICGNTSCPAGYPTTSEYPPPFPTVSLPIPDSSDTTSNQPPIADVGPDQTVESGDRVTLDGTGSSDPDGDVLTYQWSQTGGPQVILSGNRSPSPVFTAPSVSADSTLTFQLIVTDTHGAQSTPDTVNVEVKFVNHPPVAVVKSDPSSAEVSTEVTLDGSQSYDPDPDDSIAEYQWQQVDNT